MVIKIDCEALGLFIIKVVAANVDMSTERGLDISGAKGILFHVE